MTKYPFDSKPLVASLLAITNDGVPTKDQREKLITSIAEVSDDWIQQEPLLEVSLRLIALRRIDPLSLTGSRLAKLLQRLTQSEVAPGGPYRATVYDIRLTNFAIQKLLKILGISLSPLDSYILESIPRKLSQLEQKIFDALCHEVPNFQRVPSTRTNKFTDEVIKHTQSYLHGVNSYADSLIDRMIQKVKEVDINGEVSCLALDFYNSLAEKPTRLTHQIFVDIGVANYCAWIAYAIYDDFIDDEGKSQLLPVANIAHRYSIMKYQEIANRLEVSSKVVTSSFDSVDAGSIIELQKFKAKIIDSSVIEIPSLPEFADYNFLSERALGFVAGPLLILETLGEASSAKKSLMRRGLSAFLQARQISDDLTDWRSDLHSGRLSSVVVRGLIDAQIKPSSYDMYELDKMLSLQLWQSTFVGMTHTIRDRTTKAESLIKSSAIFNKNAPFYKHYIEPLLKNAIDLEQDHLLKTRFLEAYKS